MTGVDAEDTGDVFNFFVFQVLDEALLPLRCVQFAVVIAFVGSVQRIVEPFERA